MADHGGFVEALFGNVARQVLGHRGRDIARGIVLGRRAGEALDVDAVDAVTALELFGQQVKGVG